TQAVLAKEIWDPKDFPTLRAAPIQNASVTKKDIEDLQKILHNLQVGGKAQQSLASPNWIAVNGKFSFRDFLRVLAVSNYSRVSMEKPFEGLP
ncbi:MAG: hypothetical protein ACREBS_05295, partial [Nitrososphaerales archaeon]